MKILLTGSSGFIGKHISEKLKVSGYDTVEVNRKNGVDFTQMNNKSDWLPHLQSVDVVINCVGIIVETKKQSFNSLHFLAPSALFRACEESGVSRVIQISALGADENAFTPYQLSKKAADEVLRDTSLDWFILRPSLVYGEEGTSTRFFKRIAALPIIPLIDGGKQYIQPVHINDLVDVVLACLVVKSAKQTIDVVGPQVITLAEWLQRLNYLAGKNKIFIISIPYQLMLWLSTIFQFFIPLLHPDNLRMLQQGNTSKDKSMVKVLGRKPYDLP